MNPADVLNMFVADVLTDRPAVAQVFIERRMGCVGCAFAPFETIAEVATTYGIDGFELANAVAAAASRFEELHS